MVEGVREEEEEEEEEADQVEWRAWEAVKSVDSNTRYTAALPQVTCEGGVALFSDDL